MLFTNRSKWCIQIVKKEIQFRTVKQRRFSGKHDYAAKETVMGAMKENPRYNVVSIRVSDEELEALQEVCKETNKSVSTVMREAMSLIRSKAENSGVYCTTA
jgi:hypothetical protein